MQRLLLCEEQGLGHQGQGEEVLVAAQALLLLADHQAAGREDGGEGGQGVLAGRLEEELVPVHCRPETLVFSVI